MAVKGPTSYMMLNCPSCVYFVLLLFISMNIKPGIKSEHVASISRIWGLSWYLEPLMLQWKKNFQQFSGNHYVVAPMWVIGRHSNTSHPFSPKHASPSQVPGKGPGHAPSHGWSFPMTKTVSNSILQCPKTSVLLLRGGETVAAVVCSPNATNN